MRFGYRFAFNGMEQDNEVAGSGNTIAFEARIYDSRLGRFFSTDPWEKKYAWQSSYAYFKNSPISTIDFLGKGKDPLDRKNRKTNRRLKRYDRALTAMAVANGTSKLSQQNFADVRAANSSNRWFYRKTSTKKNVNGDKVDNKGERSVYRIDDIYLNRNYDEIAADRGIPVPAPVQSGVPYVTSVVVGFTDPWSGSVVVPTAKSDAPLATGIKNADLWQVTVTTTNATAAGNADQISVLGTTGNVLNARDVVATPMVGKALSARVFTVTYNFDPTNYGAGPIAGITWNGPVLQVTTTGFITQRLVKPMPQTISYTRDGFREVILGR